MSKQEIQGFRTRAVHAGHGLDPVTGAHAVPIYATSTFGYGNAERGARLFAGEEPGYFYSRLSNPTVRAFEDKVASLEGAADAVAFGSGMGAASAVALTFLKSGDEVAFVGPLYGGTEGLLRDILGRFGVTVHEARDVEELRAVVTEKTRLLWLETPTNPTLKVVDLQAASEVAHAVGALVVVDNTFSTPYLTRPLEFGADLVMHSATKYLGGHGDVVAGVVAGSAELTTELRLHGLRHVGAVLGPFEAYLLLRGLKTLPLRMEAHCANAQALAEALQGHPAIKALHYPGLPDHPGHDVAARQMRAFGGLVSLDLGSQEAAFAFLNNLKLFTQAVSLGDVESLSSHPASTTHQLLGEETLERQGVTPGLVRLSVGIEDQEDLIRDVLGALEKVPVGAGR
ncbi:PLP-dependent transferase [Deinococcus metallilatus]|uniref:Methionine-gamma-lyase n=2 Tax=Deinococcus metallilatus TaxID=1211322 RepID=A0AAJ5JZ74_9DEIO|nr:PLP-dependent aspartate aminotransferase family protein [Deinococcus metallilatus]MBB5294486.1 methionine-gamma-lyase [Deinococcus metallilatus]QBY07538.1 PLP-dependent transferase [Deinococcus metallilatus]RXJ13954.1 PLP-dependent transferase [Deinococcus metallilatus]TLK29919.1 PLP-dependent transferase [Deinococcus metallilatus]